MFFSDNSILTNLPNNNSNFKIVVANPYVPIALNSSGIIVDVENLSLVLANADILEGVEVAYNIHATDWLNFAGANMTGYPVVSDQGIITGGFGGD